MSLQQDQSCENGDPTLPTYSVSDDESLLAKIKQSPNSGMPVLCFPESLPLRYLIPECTDAEYNQRVEQHQLQADIVTSFFAAIERGQDDVVLRFISGGLVSPDTTNASGETPLLAAVRVRRVAMVRELITLGALVDGYGSSTFALMDGNDQPFYPQRTPLQLAAETGVLSIVKVLMQDYGADDSLIAPDGALALRLAAANGHREIVDYLPVRRGGAWQRWKHAHKTEMERIRRAFAKIGKFLTFFVWDVPKFFVWVLPKEIAQSAVTNVKSAWKRRHEIKGWVKKQITELPSRLRRAGASVAKGLKKIPRILKAATLRTWKTIKAIPTAVKTVAQWIGSCVSKVCRWIGNVVTRTSSFVHTAIVAVISWFKQITLKDVWNGFCSVLDAFFVGFPKLLLSLMKSFAKFSLKTLEVLFGTLGLCLWYCAKGIWWLLWYIPHKLWQSLQAVGRLLCKAWDEILVYFNPKKV